MKGDDLRPKGRGAGFNPKIRYRDIETTDVDDGWSRRGSGATKILTRVYQETARSILTENQSPDIPFEVSINPYRGCEHGCVYCYARPTHAYLDLSPGLDFETRLFAKMNARSLLCDALARPRYRCRVIALGANTDAYQPVERKLGITRGIMEVLAETRHPVVIISKSSLPERDLDLLAPMAAQNLAKVYISVTSLSTELMHCMEPRASAPARRLATIETLARAGVPVGVMFAPIIPGLNDHELEAIIDAAANAGAKSAGYVMLRLPREVNPLFQNWLKSQYPLKYARAMALVRETRAGRENDTKFGRRLRGSGAVADIVTQRFERAVQRHGLNESEHELATTHFVPPHNASSPQLALF